MFRHLNIGKEAVDEDIFYVDKVVNEIQVEMAMQYTDSYIETIKAFANNVLNPEGGSHLTGFRSALTRVINDYARKTGPIKRERRKFTGEDCREGLTAVILVKLPDPQFEGQTKSKLGNPEVRGCVEQVMTEYFSYYLEEHPGIARKILRQGYYWRPELVKPPALPAKISSEKVFETAPVCLANWPTAPQRTLKTRKYIW